MCQQKGTLVPVASFPTLRVERRTPYCGGGVLRVMARLPAAQHGARAGSPLCGGVRSRGFRRAARPSSPTWKTGASSSSEVVGPRSGTRALHWEEDHCAVPRVLRQAWHTADELADGRVAVGIGGLSMDGPVHGQANALVLTLIWTPRQAPGMPGPSLLKARVAHPYEVVFALE